MTFVSALKKAAAPAVIATALFSSAPAEAGCSNGACPGQPSHPEQPTTPPINQNPVVNQNPVIIQKPELNQSGTIIQKPELNQTGVIVQKPEINNTNNNTFKPENNNTFNPTVNAAGGNASSSSSSSASSSSNSSSNSSANVGDVSATTGDSNANNSMNLSQSYTYKQVRQAPMVTTYATGECPSGFGFSVAFAGVAGGASHTKQDKFCLGVKAAGKILDTGVALGDVGIVAGGLASLRQQFDSIDVGMGIVTTNMYKPCAEAAGKRSAIMLTDPNLNCNAFTTRQETHAHARAEVRSTEPVTFIFNIDNDVTVAGAGSKPRKHHSSSNKAVAVTLTPDCLQAQREAQAAQNRADKICRVTTAPALGR